eukprot:TRINITY_DN4029_c0_g1_i1.p1 TRINITY_DN4029_c0_g1~~TRINITY_DN4029_c0_g1_i1.p1  ORF type:complete len:770 (-),score=118.04 TRINITY_DN4029_c0_g1_i1:334-2643(-)
MSRRADSEALSFAPRPPHTAPQHTSPPHAAPQKATAPHSPTASPATASGHHRSRSTQAVTSAANPPLSTVAAAVPANASSHVYAAAQRKGSLVPVGEDLWQSAGMGDFAAVKRILETRSGMESVNCVRDGHAPLHHAAIRGNLDVARLLISCGALVNMLSSDGSGDAPLHYAALNGHYDLVNLLIDHGAHVNLQDKHGRTALHNMAEYGRDDKTTELLIQRGANVHICNEKGETPLHLAVCRQNSRALDLLLKAGADPNRGDRNGRRPIHNAVESHITGNVQLLLDHGANVNSMTKTGSTPLHIAALMGLEEISNLLLNYSSPINAQDEKGNTPLMLAASSGFKDLCISLLKKGADANRRNYANLTALHLCLHEGHLDVARGLIKHGADPFVYELQGFGDGAEIKYGPEIVDLITAAQLKTGKVDLTSRLTKEQSLRQKFEKMYEEEHARRIEVEQQLSTLQAQLNGMSGTGIDILGETMTSTSLSATALGMNAPTWEEVGLNEIQFSDCIGQGEFSEVYKAKWRGTIVAVKKWRLIRENRRADVTEQDIADFKREISILNNVRHPNIVLFMGASTTTSDLCIITEYLPRGTLFHLLADSSTPLSMKLRMKMGLNVAMGCCYLHERNPPIWHRDMKTLNLLVDNNYVVKIADFGLAKIKNRSSFANTFCGTPAWMAPEVLKKVYTEKADIYSFGVILWELLTRKKPFFNMNPLQIVYAVERGERPGEIPPDSPSDIVDLIDDCLLHDYEKRPSFRQIISQFGIILANMS